MQGCFKLRPILMYFQKRKSFRAPKGWQHYDKNNFL